MENGNRKIPIQYVAYTPAERNLSELCRRGGEQLKESLIAYLVIDCEERKILHSGDLGVIAKLLNIVRLSEFNSHALHADDSALPGTPQKFIGLISTPEITDVIKTTGLHHQKNLILFDNWDAFLAKVVEYCRQNNVPIKEMFQLGEVFMRKFRLKQKP